MYVCLKVRMRSLWLQYWRRAEDGVCELRGSTEMYDTPKVRSRVEASEVLIGVGVN